MQKLKMFSVRDAKAEIYNAPFYKRSIGEAERDFKTALTDDKNPNAKYPEDFDLFLIGEYDDSTGLVTPLQTPQHIAKAIDLINRQ